MKHLSHALLFSLFVLLLAAGAPAGAATCPAPMPSMFPPAPAAFTQTAVADGAWSLATTWSGGSVPGAGAIVCIPKDRTVSVTHQETSRLRYVQVNGELRMKVSANTRLYVDTLYVDSGGLFQIGTPTIPVQANQTAELVFISWDGNPINRIWDAEEKSRGFISMGTVKIYGENKTHMVPMTSNAKDKITHLTLDSAPANWKVGDSIVVTGSSFRQVTCTEPCTSSQDERVTITAISGSLIDFTPPLVYNHTRPRSDLRLHVANLTRNVIFRSESPSAIPLRGHAMFMVGDVDIRHAAFVDLGRTNKAVPLDDMVVTETASDYSIVPRASALVQNRRGRYPVHFHINGIFPNSAPPSKVYNSVIDGTPGWGFVNHSSHVDFQNDVAYDFTGAGFVAEMGDELGNFDNNIAIRGTGNGEYRPNQIVFANPERPQPLSDFGFSGDGFWFQGPAVRARNNVAAGCDGVGMIWFTTGAPDVNDRVTSGGVTHDRYSGFPRGAVGTVYAGFPDLGTFLPRYWDHSVTDEKLVISDLPILECDGFEGYGNLVGFRLRFNNFSNTAWYGEPPFNFVDHIEPVIGTSLGNAERMREKVKNLTLWNNENGLLPNYASRTDWSAVDLVNRLDYNSQSAYVGAEMDRQLKETTFTDLKIDGYEVAGLVENGDFVTRDDITFLGAQTYVNYATFDTWTKSISCPLPTGMTVSPVSATSKTISWTANTTHKRFMVRYRMNGDPQWKLVTATSPSVTLTGLATGKTYTYQVIAGCKDAAGKETAPSLYTVAAPFNT